MRAANRLGAYIGGALLGLSLTGCGTLIGLDDYRDTSSTVNGLNTGANGSGANGGNPAGPGGSAGGGPLRVFVTSTTYTGALGEDAATALATANSACQLRAEAGNLGGTWIAWLTTNGLDMHHLDDFGPWHLPRSGAMVVESMESMMACQCLGAAIVEDEMGPLGPEPDPPNVWTGTDSAAASVEVDPLTDNCNQWTTDDAMYQGVSGSLTDTRAWTYAGNTVCSDYLRLYCFEIP